tara:strand:+ start:230 stop:415 length:186 start_codon:yes stop_codon:yes gene_type:complete
MFLQVLLHQHHLQILLVLQLLHNLVQIHLHHHLQMLLLKMLIHYLELLLQRKILLLHQLQL